MSDDDPKPRGQTANDRDAAARRMRAEGAPRSRWTDEPTGVHDDQVFRALKALGQELEANKLEAARAHGALTQRVASVEQGVIDIKAGLAENTRVTERIAGRMDVILADRRPQSSSSQQRAAAKEVLAEEVLAEQRSSRAFGRRVWLILLGGAVAFFTSGAFIAWLLTGKP